MMVKPDLLWHSISTNILSIYSKCTIEANYTTVKFKRFAVSSAMISVITVIVYYLRTHQMYMEI